MEESLFIKKAVDEFVNDFAGGVEEDSDCDDVPPVVDNGRDVDGGHCSRSHQRWEAIKMPVMARRLVVTSPAAVDIKVNKLTS